MGVCSWDKWQLVTIWAEAQHRNLLLATPGTWLDMGEAARIAMLLAMGVPPPCRLSEEDYATFEAKRALGERLPRCSGTIDIGGKHVSQRERCYLPNGHAGPCAKCGGHDKKCLRFVYPGKAWEPATGAVCGSR